jgi:hypothetical protein
MDVTRALTWHLALLDQGIRYAYRVELYLLATLWKMFRGKKRNVLRQRTDTMAYDSMQLLLGSLLFAVTLFLLTTILVYYVFFTLLNLLVRAGASVVIWSLYTLLQDFPFGSCYLRWRNPELFVSSVYLSQEVIAKDSSGGASERNSSKDNHHTRTILRLLSVSQSLPAVITTNPMLVMRAKAFRSWLVSGMSEIVSGAGGPKNNNMIEQLTAVE